MASWLLLHIGVFFVVVGAVRIPSGGPYELKYQFQGTPDDHTRDRGKSRISASFVADTSDLTQGFPGAYNDDQPGGNNVFIDSDGYLVIQPTCPVTNANGTCKAVQCNEKMVNGMICQCDNTTISHKYFPWWCQLDWGGGKIISQTTFNINPKGGLFVFEDLWIPRGKPLWPAVWLTPSSDPYYGGSNTPKGGNWAVWPNNGEIDILETVGYDPRIYGTLHFQCGNEYNGWPSFVETVNSSAVQGTAYKGPLQGNVLALHSSGDNPLPQDGHIGSLCFQWFIDDQMGPTFAWYIADGNPVQPDGSLKFKDQVDVLLNRFGTDPDFNNITGDGSGTLSFGTTPFWPGSRGNSPPLTLYKGWDGKESYGFQGYYPVQGNVRTADVGVHDGVVSSKNPHGLGIVPEFAKNGSIIPGTIAELYEPYLCSMIGNWQTPQPLPWPPVPCQNPPPGYAASDCPLTGTGPSDSYNYCWVEGADRPGVGWWSNSPLAKGVPFAPFDPNQNWNIILNVAIGGQWPRAVGQEGDWGEDFSTVLSKTNLKLKSIKYYEIN